MYMISELTVGYIHYKLTKVQLKLKVQLRRIGVQSTRTGNENLVTWETNKNTQNVNIMLQQGRFVVDVHCGVPAPPTPLSTFNSPHTDIQIFYT